MLSEILLAGDTIRRPGSEGISLSLVFPCPHAIYRTYHNTDGAEFTPQDQLNMNNGKWQEEETVMALKSEGIEIQDRQKEVKVGKARVIGHIDGTVSLNGKKRLFEHKAMSWERYSQVKQHKLTRLPGYKAQVQLYMLGMGLDECDFYCKHKDSNEPWDFIEPLDEKWALKIVAWLDAVILDEWKPEPALVPECSHCGLHCFGQLVDFSHIAQASAPEMVKKWKQGKLMSNIGDMMVEEARAFFVGKTDKYGNELVRGLIGDKDFLVVEDLEIKKIVQHRFDISKARVMEVFGPEALLKVGEERDIVTYRFKEV